MKNQILRKFHGANKKEIFTKINKYLNKHPNHSILRMGLSPHFDSIFGHEMLVIFKEA